MEKAYSLPSSKKKNLVSAIKSIISKLKEFLNKLSNQMPEVKALKDNINAQIKMAEIFAKNVEQSNSNTDSKNKKYLYLGTESKTANISKLNKAKEMEEDGASSESIRKTTGWFKSYDGKWRYEISDKDIQYSRDGKFTNDSQLKRKNELFNKFLMGTITSEEMNEYSNLNSNRAVKPVFLSDFVKHDKLFKSYPQLKEVTLSIDSDMVDKEKGFYDNGLKEIHINSKLTGDEAVKTILHEVQHVIQHIEKFATGANGSNENYNRVAGEIEARDSAHRSNFTEEQRKNIRPDIDRTDVVFNDYDINFNIKRTKNMNWRDQVQGYLKIKDKYHSNIKSSDTLVLDTDTPNYLQKYGIKNLPLAIPIKVLRKAQSTKNVDHTITDNNIVKLNYGINNPSVVVIDYNRNTIGFITDIKNKGRNIAIFFDNDSLFDGDNVHKASSVHTREDFISYLNKLDGAKIFINKNKSIDVSGTSINLEDLKQSNELIELTLSQNNGTVNSSIIDESRKLGANLPGKKFSVFEDGTEKNLVAMHNLSAENLETALKRGGLPMPSIAVTKDSISHNEFGDVSVLFDKDTIDPEQDNNYVYGNDVFSPTYPALNTRLILLNFTQVI